MNDDLPPHRLVGEIYKKNHKVFAALESADTHDFSVDVAEWPIDEQQVEFDGNDFPYLRVALLDRWLEDQFAE